MIASAQLGCLAAATALCGAFIHRLDRLAVVLLGAVISLIAMIALALSPGSVLFIAMPLSGIGFGLCCAGGNAIIASSHDPARLSARSWALMMPWQMLIWAIAPAVSDRWAMSGLFALQAAGVAVMLVPLAGVALGARGNRAAAAAITRPSVHSRLSTIPLLLIAACTAAFWLRDSAIWSLVERRAAALDIDGATLSAVLSAGTLIGLAGPAATIRIGLRFGRVRTVTASQVLIAAIFLAVSLVKTPMLYCLAFLFWSGTSIFAWNYIVEMTAALDASGRTTAICGGLVFGAAALGPLLGGIVLDSGSTIALPALVGMLSLAAIGFAYAVARGLRRSCPTTE